MQSNKKHTEPFFPRKRIEESCRKQGGQMSLWKKAPK
jgi:hypothetical protein